MDSFSLLNYWRSPAAGTLINTTAAAAADDDGSFFDLEFTLPSNSTMTEDDKIFNLTVSPDTAGQHEHSVEQLLGTSDSKPAPSLLLKSATKLRILMLAFMKPKPIATTEPNSPPNSPRPNNKYLIKFKAEGLPIVSLFNGGKAKPGAHAADERRPSIDAVSKYLNKIKPLYVRVSRRYVRISGHLGMREGEDGDRVVLPAGMTVVCKRRLGKSRSASMAAAAAESPARRRDDSLKQREDGIQGAIAHCKRSFNSARGGESPLVRSTSDPGTTESH